MRKLLILFIYVFAAACTVLCVGCSRAKENNNADLAAAKGGESGKCDTDTAAATSVESEKVLVSFSFIDEAGLKNYADYDLFTENGDWRKIAFTSVLPAKDFSWLSISFAEDPDFTYKIDEELYSIKELSPQKPFVVTWQEVGIFAHRGFSYRDESGQKQYYSLHEGNYGQDPEEYGGPDLVARRFYP